ncbi:MAG: hypothetical protein E7657_02250 [Ruminococcaceae bacterium]|nr:hypothetical protein [Oscillospiraceae bacterium]
MKKRLICLFLALLLLFLFFACESKADPDYILNLSSKKVHLPDCKWAKEISEKNRSYTNSDLIDIINAGFSPCKVCLD